MKGSPLFVFFLVLAFLLPVILILQNLDIEIPITGKLISIGSGILGAIGLGGIGLFYLITKIRGRETSSGEEKFKEALDLCEEMLYDIRKNEGKRMNEEKFVKKTINKITPSLLTLMKNYKGFKSRLFLNQRIKEKGL